MTTQLEITFISAFKLVGMGVGIPLLLLFFTGMFTAILQAVTQVQDQILGYFPKIVLTFILLLVAGPTFLNLVKSLLAECMKMASFGR